MGEVEVDSDWSTNANDAFAISLVSAIEQGKPKTIATFNPQFTYPIFGDDEQIFGYQGLKISLRFNASDMRPHLKVASLKRFEAIGDTEPADVEGALRPFLPDVAFTKSADFEKAIKQVPEKWKPPGTRIATFDAKDGQYEVWKGSLRDLAVQQMVKRVQILVSLFIEAGTPIGMEPEDEPLDRWTVFFLYQRQPVSGKTGQFSYVFAGYSTVYRFFVLQLRTPPASPVGPVIELPQFTKPLLEELPCRSRISQFIILEPFKHKGNGARLYNTIFNALLKDKPTVEITVEDPNEAFDDMRDLADLAFLRQQADFNELQLNTSVVPAKAPSDIIDQKALEALRRKYKIVPRQLKRVLEMQLMSKLHDSVRKTLDSPSESESPSEGKGIVTKEHEHEHKLFRLLVKSRLYAQHRDVLAQLEPSDRKEKLQETFQSVELEYARLLSFSELRQQKAEPPGKGKRKATAEQDDEVTPKSKKARVDKA